MSEDFYELNLKNGGNLIYWLKNAAFVNEFLAKYNREATAAAKITALTPELQQNFTLGFSVVTPDMQPAASNTVEVKMANSIKKEKALAYKWWHGGIRSPHLHSDNKIYLLTQAQWSTFVDSAMKNLGKQLASAKNVSFDSFKNVSESVEAIT